MFEINDLPVEFDIEDVSGFLEFAAEKLDLRGFMEVSVSFLTAEEIRILNAENRQKDEATDILTFALSGPVPDAALGDIYICMEQVCDDYSFGSSRQALFFVLAHGILHLIGRTHELQEELLILREEQASLVLEYDKSQQLK
jgi:probable rRNA maturation factor